MKTDSKRIDNKLAKLAVLQKEIEMLQVEAEQIREEIKTFMGEEEELITENYIVKWTKVTSNRFDQSAFKLMHPDMYESFKTVSESRRFSFK